MHVCDHSNSPLFNAVDKQAKILTCHDLIAIRSANNEFSGQLPRFQEGPYKQLSRKQSHGKPYSLRFKATESDFIHYCQRQKEDKRSP